MSQYLSYGGFKWLNNGYILEADLEYPDELHELRNDYPLAPENLEISDDMLSKYQCQVTSGIAKKYEIKFGDVNKLVSSFDHKSKHIVHYSNLQLYLSLGMKLAKIHRVLKFKQSDLMKTYVDFHIESRKNAANSFEKQFFKLMINNVYDKTM